MQRDHTWLYMEGLTIFNCAQNRKLIELCNRPISQLSSLGCQHANEMVGKGGWTWTLGMDIYSGHETLSHHKNYPAVQWYFKGLTKFISE